jgi:serine/threonine protein kinase
MLDMNLALDPSTDAARQRLAGAVIAGKYRLDELLGVGSQGMVWKAHNLALDLPVAVKLMHPSSEVGMTGPTLAPNRLFREAHAAATLGHPGIVRVFDFGRTTDGLAFLTMELLQGVSLARHLEDTGRLSPELAVRLILPIADALSSAHAQGIVHRDVKPENILLSISAGQMQPKLLDFGIASVADGQALTQAGCVVGTPNYLPPEQARGLAEVDARADVWALCATLYECVTGAVPFAAVTWIDVLRRIIDDEPDPIAAHGVNDLELWRLIRKGLAKEPSQRWSSIQEFARAASRWLLARRISCDICGVSVESRWLQPASASMLTSGETGTGTTWWEHAPAPPPQRRLSAGHRRMLAWSAPFLGVAAIIGVTRASAWVLDSPDEVPQSTISQVLGSEVLGLQPAQAAPALALPEVVEVPVASNPATREVPAASPARPMSPLALPHKANSTPAAPGVSAPPRLHAPKPSATYPEPPTTAADMLTPAPTAKPEPPVRRAAPAKPATAKTRDTLDLMNPY